MAKTINLERAQLARLNSDLHTLLVNYTNRDGQNGTLRWSSADAEQRYNKLKSTYERLQEKERRMNVENE
jgi:hypothetical protein